MLTKTDALQFVRVLAVRRLGILLWLGLVGVCWPMASFHVAPEGDDTGAGTADSPFATLLRARDAVRELKQNGLPDGGVTVWVHGGRYFPGSTLHFTPEDSGEPDKPIVYAAWPGDTPVISGGRVIDGWTRLDEDPAGLPASARGRLWVADVPKGWRFHYLFCDGIRQTRARRPNSENIYDGSLPQIVEWRPVDPKGQVLTFPEGALDHVPGNGFWRRPDGETPPISRPRGDQGRRCRDVYAGPP